MRCSRICPFFGLILLLFLWLPVPSVQGQGVIQVASSAATADFPKQISFRVMATDSAADINSVVLLYRIGRDPVIHEAVPEFTPGRQVETEYVLDTQVNYLPPGAELTYYWTLGDGQANNIESPPQSVTYHDQRFRWNELNQSKVTVYWYQGNADFGQQVLQAALRTLDRLGKETGAKVQDPIKIYIYGNRDDFYSALPPNSTEWIGGQSFSNLSLICAQIAPGSGDVSEIKRTIPHEMSHIVIHQATENPYNGPPLWLDEGLAVHYQEEQTDNFDSILNQAAKQADLIPLSALASNFPTDRDRAILSYAESYNVVEFILKRYGSEKMSALVSSFKQGVTYDEALQGSLGLSVDDLDGEWRATLPAAQVTPTPFPDDTATPQPGVEATPLPPDVPVVPVPQPTPQPALARLVSLGLLAVLSLCLPVLVAGAAVVAVIFALRRRG
ncbi:MAG: peptidase MA family metallohydrolase [Chloroflexi bacterium]|nr:peptidase MA family metallohydrolase [Chloroflexota bacterium]